MCHTTYVDILCIFCCFVFFNCKEIHTKPEKHGRLNCNNNNEVLAHWQKHSSPKIHVDEEIML